MDLKQIKELMSAMERAGIKKLAIKQKSGDELHLERQDEYHPHPTPAPIAAFYPPAVHASSHSESIGKNLATSSKSHTEESHKIVTKEEKPGKYVTSPLVGTYYSAQSPEDPVFIKVGDQVNENTVICIVEAMKVMNEVKAGLSGTVAEILVENAHPVEFGTKIIRVV